MQRSLWRQDLAWAGFLLALAVAFGLLSHWPLVRLSQRGELPAYLEKLRNQNRELRFQGVKTVSLAQAYALWSQGQALFVDARDGEEYAELHIPGALSLPAPEVKKGLGLEPLAEIGKDRSIVIYCGQASCDASLTVAEKLQSLGFQQVAAFLGGFRAWDEAGYPVDTTR
jgi:rhodanese-related sulfurtransferase